MTAFADLSLEIIDRILLTLDPLDVACISQTSRFFYEIIYGSHNQQFWRSLYLAQPLDDPRRTVTYLGARREDIGWRGELQQITRARTVIRQPNMFRREERRAVLRACIDLITHVAPLSSPDGVGAPSRNVRWLVRHIGDKDGAFLERTHDAWAGLDAEEEQLLARLHALYGLTRRDVNPAERRASQAFVYSQRHHTAERGYGPFLPDGRRCVDWVFVWTLVHVFGMLLLEADGGEEEECSTFCCPLSLAFCQSIIPRGVDLDREEDWAGVEGLWSVRYGFMDHREFILYNDPSVPDHEPQDTSIFDGTEETLATIDIYFRVAGTEPDPLHPTRPKINIIGEVDGKFNIVGFIKLTEDDQVWWHYEAGNDDQMVWNCEAIGLGGIRSRCGCIGVWSTVFHDVEDPIGPFWLQRELLVDEDE